MEVKKTKSFHHIFTPIRDLLSDSRTTGVLLVICTIISLFVTNSFSNGWFNRLWNNPFVPGIFSSAKLPHSFIDWINNFGMAFFFVLAATEIKENFCPANFHSLKRRYCPLVRRLAECSCRRLYLSDLIFIPAIHMDGEYLQPRISLFPLLLHHCWVNVFQSG